VYSPDQPQLPGLGYGRYRFDSQNPADATTKWNCLFREKNITVRDYTYRCYSIVGTLSDVTNAMTDLDAYFRAIPADAPHNEQPGSP
jgi:hypothetical protein